MNVIPAVDLKEGQCVRLLQGDKDRETQYSDDPVAMAQHWEDAGARRLHIVDLDGAFEGESKNRETIKDIIDTLDIPCEVGGGIRSAEAVDAILDAGADAVIIGTAGVNRPSWLGDLVDEFGPERVYAGVDCRNGRVMVKGWEETSAFELLEWIERLEKMGVKNIIYTDVERDGAEVGPDYERTADILRETSMNVIASGGVGTLEHLEKFESIATEDLIGVIVGRALYENNFDFSEARRALDF